jgi:uncharacterized membrane protein YbhN (UPF0104 family)
MSLSRKNLSLILRVSLSLLAIAYVIEKLRTNSHPLWLTFQEAHSYFYLLIAVSVALLPFNLGIEAAKWRMLVRSFYPAVTLWTAMKAVLTGMASGIFTPNRIGEYAGRILWLEEGHRLEALVLTFFDRIAQMFVTLVTGLFACMILFSRYKTELVNQVFGEGIWLTVFLALSAAGLILLFFVMLMPEKSIGWLLAKSKKEWAVKVKSALHLFTPSLMRRIVLLSLLRWMVFTTQYLLLLFAFGFSGSVFLGVGMISLVYLCKSLLPTLGFAELGVREWIAIEVMGIFGLTAAQAFASTFFLYILNFLLPTVLGALALLSMQTERKRS